MSAVETIPAGLAFEAREVEANPFMPQDSSDMRHWFCSVSGDGVPSFEFYVSQGEDVTAPPSAEMALALVMEDVRVFRECEGYADFARLLGIEDDDPAGVAAWDELGRIAGSVEAVADRDMAPSASL